MDNNNKLPILPNYILKYFVKIISNEINYFFKAIDPITIGYTYREKEREIKSLTINTSLVSKLFFETLSNNLNVLVYFDYKKFMDNSISGTGGDSENSNNNSSIISSNKSILKLENVKVLKLHYDHEAYGFYKPGNIEKIILIPFEVINKQIKEIKSLEKLVLRNINLDSYTLDFLYQVEIPPTISQVKILEFKITDKTKDYIIDSIHHICKKLYSVVVSSFKEESIVFHVFKLWLHSIKQLFILGNQFSFPFLNLSGNILDNHQNQQQNEFIDNHHQQQQEKIKNQLLYESNQLNKINYLFNIKYLEFLNSSLSLKEFYCILLASPKLEFFSTDICLERLNYIFSNDFNRQKVKCKCRSIFYENYDEATFDESIGDPFSGFSHFDDSEDNDEVIKSNQHALLEENHKSIILESLGYWNKIKSLNQQIEAKLKLLKIRNSCSSFDNTTIPNNNDTLKQLNNNCSKELSLLLSSPKFKNIQELELSLLDYNLIPFINYLDFNNSNISRYIFNTFQPFNSDIEKQIKNKFNTSNYNIYFNIKNIFEYNFNKSN